MNNAAKSEKSGNLNSWMTLSTPNTKLETPTPTREEGKVKNDSINKHALAGTVGIRTNFECYFQPWFRLCYYLFLIPFKIETSGNGSSTYFVSTNLVQKSLCALVHVSLGLTGALEIHSSLREGRAQGNPVVFIRLLDTINSVFYCTCFSYTVWFKRKSVLGIFGDPRESATQSSKQIKKWSTIATVGIVAFSVLGLTCWLLSYDLANIVRGSIVESVIEKGLHEFWRASDDAEIPDTLCGMNVHVTVLILLAFRLCKWFLNDLLIFLPFLTSFITYTMTKEFRQILVDSVDLPADADVSNVFESYKKVKQTLIAFNEVMGPFYVLVFFSVITFGAGSAADILDSKSWIFPILIFISFAQNAGMLVLSAETHHQVSYFKTWLLVPWKRSHSTLAICAEVEDSNLANKGGRLFTITYNFLGTACGVALTYAMIVIQYKGTNCSCQPPQLM